MLLKIYVIVIITYIARIFIYYQPTFSLKFVDTLYFDF